MGILFELTDTFGGEANYSWVKRGHYTGNKPDSHLSVIREAKHWAGLSGVRCRVENWGDTVAIYPAGACVVLFINWEA